MRHHASEPNPPRKYTWANGAFAKAAQVHTLKTIEHGVCEFTVYNRMLMPLYYGEGFDMEYKALTEDVAVWDVAAERQVELLGPQMRTNLPKS